MGAILYAQGFTPEQLALHTTEGNVGSLGTPALPRSVSAARVRECTKCGLSWWPTPRRPRWGRRPPSEATLSADQGEALRLFRYCKEHKSPVFFLSSGGLRTQVDLNLLQVPFLPQSVRPRSWGGPSSSSVNALRLSKPSLRSRPVLVSRSLARILEDEWKCQSVTDMYFPNFYLTPLRVPRMTCVGGICSLPYWHR